MVPRHVRAQHVHGQRLVGVEVAVVGADGYGALDDLEALCCLFGHGEEGGARWHGLVGQVGLERGEASAVRSTGCRFLLSCGHWVGGKFKV